MKSTLMKMLSRQLRETADKIDSGSCELTQDEAMDLFSVISHESMSKAQVCKYLNISIGGLGHLVRTGIIPKGRKVLGYTELRWYKDELDNYFRWKKKEKPESGRS